MERLTQRADFLAAAAAARVSAPAFVLQARDRGDARPPRFGFTVSRKVGTAVERNRVRRRLKATVTLMDPAEAKTGHDYVLIGRRAALAHPFGRLGVDLQHALRRVSAGGATPSSKRSGRSRGPTPSAQGGEQPAANEKP